MYDLVEQIPFRKHEFHGEQYIEQLKQLPPEGIINVEIKTLDVLDKGKGTLYCFISKNTAEIEMELQTVLL